MTDRDASLRFEESQRPPALQAAITRARWIMSAAIGITWGPAILYFVTHMAFVMPPANLALLGVSCVSGWTVAHYVPRAYFLIREPLRARRFYRWLGIPNFRRWMMDGDLMNSRLRRSLPTYRLVGPRLKELQAYARRTEWIERRHLAWLLASFPAVIFAAVYGHWRFAMALTLLNVVTNVLPILLQRYNRLRCEAIVQLMTR